MAVYVDKPIFPRAASKNPRKLYGHMVADTFQELHEFAVKIGVKKHFFHRSKTAHHYDITSDQHLVAINNGAKLVDSREIVRIGKLQR